ncbi:response regulator [Hymenobacter busanensis]|nr:ATP-binding protein [Hymenobacter busanensis]QHJ09470.1 response regulator [Hymenobacter busanensis]
MKTILLVDDNEQDRAVYRRYLTPYLGAPQYTIYEANSGEEALSEYARLKPDCVLLDYSLLDTDGLTLLQDLQHLGPPDSLCAIMITGSGNEALVVRALNNGALDYLVKGHFDRELLVKTVAHAIEKNEWRQYQARFHAELQTINQQLRDSLAELTATRQELDQKNQLLTAAHGQVQVRNGELHAANRQLARTNADLDNFVYAASHDLRQPVHNLRGLFEELRRSATFNDPDEAQLLHLFDASLHALATTIDDLATVVQTGREPGEQATERVVVQEVADEVLQTLLPQIVVVQADIQTDFSASPSFTYVRSNLRTILLNLLTNALKYRHPARTPQIQVRTYLAAEQPVLEVQDNGLGIDMERHGAELFQLFRRFHPHAGEGTGVGLFLVNRLVQAHGGRIEVESQEGQGTTFRVFLQG